MSTDPSTPDKPSLLDRLLVIPSAAANRPLQSLLVLGVATALLGAVACVWILLEAQAYAELEDRLQTGLTRLDEGDYAGAQEIAQELRSQPDAAVLDLGGPAFLSGAAIAAEATDAFDASERLRLHLLAARYLDEARFRGFPPGREPEGLFLLGRSLHDSFQYDASLPILAEAADALKTPDEQLDAERKKLRAEYLVDAAGLQASSAFHAQPPQYEAALRYNDAFLAEESREAARPRAWLLRAKILLAEEKFAEARTALKHLSEDSPLESARLLTAGRILVAEADSLLAAAAADEIAGRKTGNGVASNAEASSQGTAEKPELAVAPPAPLETPSDDPLAPPADDHLLTSPLFDEPPAPEDNTPDRLARTKYQEAERLFEESARCSTSFDQTAAQAQYFLGVALKKQNKKAAAQQQFRRAWQIAPDTPEGIAAGIEEADLLRLAGDKQGAVEVYIQTLHRAGEATADNPWLSTGELLARVDEAQRDLSEQGEFELALRMAEASSALAPPSEVQRSLAQVYASEGAQLAAEAKSLPEEERPAMIQRSRSELRQAANAYAALAEMKLATREYPALLWSSAENYLAGHDFLLAIAMFEKYLEEIPRNARPPALVQLGRAYLGRGDYAEALTPLLECIQFHPHHPDTYRARVLASEAQFEMGDLPAAIELLRKNLENEDLTPRSLEWRDSLFALGKVYLRQGSDLDAKSRQLGVYTDDQDQIKRGLDPLEKSEEAYQTAIRKLEEAVQRYPDAEQTAEARYWIAESRRLASRFPRRKLEVVSIETTRLALNEQINRNLKASISEFDQVIKQLTRKQDDSELTSIERGLLRNCYFHRADALFDLGDFTEAIAAYSSATSKYHDSPAALEAFVQISRCYRQINKPIEARGTLEQAKVLLRQIPEGIDFTSSTRYTRDEWTRLLDWMSLL
ncbi:tetratricopeptide repeat protein [Lignipirellula cremea]|uniref:Tetratricopeptide repeat protein n=1 Tax=Lignipirellula cremea TaxID=2528010 RepID=A0A518DQ49_9BACT|nr:tetratricopeptide repeat protein [Lignipirellula cremea]QDU93969.1 Tetratricopeptide repeat protein [Lignipirellula cremea]